ncbi:PTS sugar transporter [Brachybacterium alimentarium]|uniref:PTS sugar transporter subunit IIA n=2 Tax=Brachybacterium alimentarium TaxID=47845 RepID=UPI000DF3E339|nr:PTS sugar transporter subunit IIA [Brachybacterium alimentarium]RCS77766.1 PTS sugar transporter [Brachybacterium alimentarium]RCS88008.1 PTS sugar transporter [Brachybacterium alimentarium]
MSQLSDLVDPSAISLDASAQDWRAAIRLSGDLLVSTESTTSSYTDAMIRTVEEHGPYIVIAPGFALAHARPDESVLRTALSFVRLAEPIPFGNEANDPVTLVMALAAADASAHQSALAALAGVLADPTSRRELDTASTPAEVLAALGADDADAAEGADTSTDADTDAGTDAATDAGTESATSEPDADGTRSATAVSTPAPATATATAPAPAPAPAPSAASADATAGPSALVDPDAVPSKNLLLTVCGNGLGTSLFLKNTAEQVLDRWGWSSYLDIQATDTISAKGRAKEADVILTSGAIADTLGDVGVRVEVIENFTSQAEIDAVLRRVYAV